MIHQSCQHRKAKISSDLRRNAFGIGRRRRGAQSRFAGGKIRTVAAIIAFAAIIFASAQPATQAKPAKEKEAEKNPAASSKSDNSPPRTGKLKFKEPTTKRTYYMYVPSTYDSAKKYPLIVTARGTIPFDTAAGQRDSWVGIAEKNDLIICSPAVDSANGLMGFPKDKPAPALLRDEKAILLIIKEIRARYSINPDGILATGWSGGGFTAHFLGLRHPDIFRAIVGRGANFNERIVSDETARKARHIHVLMLFGTRDMAGITRQNRLANFWYTMRGFANFRVKQVTGGHGKNNRRTAEWFLNLIKTYPTARIEAKPVTGPAPLAVKFKAIAKDPDGRVQTTIFQFGDEQVSIRKEVTHTYTRPGTYNVMLTVIDNDGHREYVQVDITVK
ncbi:MAG: PKD domain-containing protein [Planctomycetia bacterium]|nr:PKD domain-containing protein [Planctomycetia bacterium]